MIDTLIRDKVTSERSAQNIGLMRADKIGLNDELPFLYFSGTKYSDQRLSILLFQQNVALYICYNLMVTVQGVSIIYAESMPKIEVIQT